MNISHETGEQSEDYLLPADLQQQAQEDADVGDISGPFIPPQCQPVSLAFPPVQTMPGAGNKGIADQSLVGLVSIAAPLTVDCPISLTSTISAIVLPQSQVIIPAGYTTAQVFAIFRGNLGVNTPAVFVYAQCSGGTPVSARIVVPTTAGPAQAANARLPAAVEVQSVTFNTPLSSGSHSPQGHVCLVGPSIGGPTTVYLSVNQDYQSYFQLPTINIGTPANPIIVTAVIVPQNSQCAPINVIIASPPAPFELNVFAQSGSNTVASNDITVNP